MQWPTHDVTNQVPDLHDVNLFTTDIALMDGVRREQRRVRKLCHDIVLLSAGGAAG